MKKRFLLLFVAMLFLFSGVVIFVDWPRKKEYIMSAEKGLAWLLSYNGKIQDPGVLWVIKNINDEYCRSPILENFINSKFSEFENLPVASAYKRLIDKNYAREIDYAAVGSSGQKFDNIMLPAIYCDSYPVPENVKNAILDVSEASGYELTHKLLAMLFLKKNGCVGKEADLIIDNAAQKILLEQSVSHSFNDLFVERLAFLEYLDKKMWIKDEWLRTLVNAQSSDGSWSSGIFLGNKKDPHATSLAVWALSEHEGVCPL